MNRNELPSVEASAETGISDSTADGADGSIAVTASLDESAMRAVSNPTRMRILGLLRVRGAMTVGEIGEAVGVASGSVSYHMRQLERAGLVLQDSTAGADGRQRWWRSRHAAMSPAPLTGTAESDSVVEYKRSVSKTYRDVYERFLDNMGTMERPWAEGATNLDTALRLTFDEFTAMTAELETVMRRWLHVSEGRRNREEDGTRDVALIIQAFPWLA